MIRFVYEFPLNEIVEIYQFYYNNLVQDFDLETKKIFDFCELHWNEKLKNFNDTEFVSHTASNIKVRENFCLPRAIRLTIALKTKEERIISDTQVINLCMPPCNKELFD